MGIFDVDLQDAFYTGQVEIRFQPVVSLHGLSVLGVEALARLRDKSGHIWLPDHFVPAAEKAGLAKILTERVAAQAIEDFSASFSPESDLWLSINLPLNVFMAPETIPMIEAHAARAHLAHERILIELTESQPVLDVEALRPVLESWAAHGFRIALDDIEPTTRNLWQLLSLPFNVVKLDLLLVNQLARDQAAVDFVTEVVRHAREHQIKIVAEGVESEEMAAQLRALGVDHAQGFLISRPMRSMMLPAWWYMWLS